MEKNTVTKQLQHLKNKRILYALSCPKTPRQIEKELGIKKIKLKPFLENDLIKLLNPTAKKGRLYIITEKTSKTLNLSINSNFQCGDMDLIGWIISSPLQRYVLLITIAIDNVKRTSENLRLRASKRNPRLSRISTKNILSELIDKGLINSEIANDKKRYYWINERGRKIVNDLEYWP